MKIAAESLFRCFRSTLPSAIFLSALSGGVGELFDLSQAVAQTGSAYSAPSNAPAGPAAPGTPAPANAPNASAAPGTPPPANAPTASAAPGTPVPANAPTQKSEAAQRVEKLCGAKNAGVVGEPLSLEKLLYGVYSPSERYRRLAAYWDLVGKRAYFNLCVECANFANECAAKVQKKYDGATVPQETAAFLAASRLVAAQRREAARIDFIRSQHAFDAAFSSPAARRAAWERRRYEAQVANAAAKPAAAVGTPTSPVLYVPTAFPSVDAYETRFDEIARRRRVSNEAVRLSAALPLFYEATQSRAEQARGEWNNLNAAFVATETTETALFAALDRYLGASRDMLAAATRYNQAIAAYVAETVPGSLQGVALLKTLNQRPNAVAPTTEGKAPNAATTVVRKTFADERPVASATFVAPAAASADSAVAPTSFVEPAPKPDLTPTPGARLEPAEPLPAPAETPSTPEQPLPAPSETPSTPAEPLPASAETPSTPTEEPTTADSGPSTIVVTGYEQPAEEPSTDENSDAPEEKASTDPAPENPSAAFFVGRIVRGQAPETPENAPAENADVAPASTTATVQKPQTPQSAANAGARRRVEETVAVLFATPKAEPSPNGGADGPREVPTTLRSVLERVPVAERAATVRAYWRLQEASARVAVESALAQTLTQAFNELKAKSSGAEAAASTEIARLYLAAALGAQARVAEARIVKRDAQIALTRRARLPLGQGWPIPATLPFVGATYRLEAPSTTSPTLALEGAVIPENLKAIETIGGAFGAPATLCSFDVSPTSAANPLVPLATLEKKRESLLLFVELVVATNVSIAEYVASYPAGFVSVDRFVDALVGPGK